MFSKMTAVNLKPALVGCHNLMHATRSRNTHCYDDIEEEMSYLANTQCRVNFELDTDLKLLMRFCIYCMSL